MRLEDIKVGLYNCQTSEMSTYFGKDESFESIRSRYIRLYENNGYLVGSRLGNTQYNFNYDLVKRNGIYYLRSVIIPKLTINDELKEYLLHNKQLKKNEIIFGYFPYHYIDYTNKNKIKTGKYIHIPSLNKEYPIYESTQGNKFYISFDKSKPTKVYLDNMVWRFGKTQNELILDSAIIEEFPLYKGLIKQKSIKYEDSLLYKYLSTDFLNDIFQFEDVFDKYNDKSENDKKEETEEQKEINDIRSIIPNDVNKVVFTERLDCLINQYNKDLNDYINSIGKSLVFGVKDDELSSAIFKNNLNQLKNDIIEYKNGAKEYEDLLTYINNIESTIINGNTYEPDEFQSFILDLMNGPIKYLNDNKYKDLIKTEICDKPRDLIDNHMKQLLSSNITTDIPFKNEEEFIYYLRKILHPILINIANDVKTKTSEERERIKLDYSKELKIKAYQEYYNKLKSLLSETLKETYEETEKVLNKYGYDTTEASRIYNRSINCCDDQEKYIKEMLNQYRELMSIYYNVCDKNELKESIIRKKVK